MAIAPYVIKAYGLKALAFERSTRTPLEAQRKLLLEMLASNKNTVFGKEHGFADIRSIEDYQARVPLSSYETFRPYIERLMRGETRVLTADDPILFGVTSGTTGKPKFIPVTKVSRKNKKEIMDVWTYYILRDHPGAFNGKILAIVSPEVEGSTTNKIPFGAESGHAYKNMPGLVKNLYVLPYEVFEIKDYDARYYCILRIAMEQNVSAIASLNPSTILLLCQRIGRIKDRVIEDIRNGALDGELNLRYDIRKKIERGLKPNPGRADELLRLSKGREGRLLPADFWPGLKVITCWKGGTVGIYIPHLKKYFADGVAIRDFGYLSSEARASIPLDDKSCAGILAVTGNFYEFVPVEDICKDNKRFFLAHQLEVGKEYYVILTTHAGLYRYNIDDIIKVTGTFNSTPVIEFKQKGSMVCSVTGEKLYEAQVNDAVTRAAESIGLDLQCYSASVEWAGTPRYSFLVEFADKNTPSESKKELLRIIEDGLAAANAEYLTKRRSQRLKHPVLKVVACGAFEEYRCKKVAAGSHDGQYKIPRLTNDINFHKNFKIEEEIEHDEEDREWRK